MCGSVHYHVTYPMLADLSTTKRHYPYFHIDNVTVIITAILIRLQFSACLLFPFSNELSTIIAHPSIHIIYTMNLVERESIISMVHFTHWIFFKQKHACSIKCDI